MLHLKPICSGKFLEGSKRPSQYDINKGGRTAAYLIQRGIELIKLNLRWKSQVMNDDALAFCPI